MKKVKLGMVFLVAMLFFAVLVVHAESNKQPQPKKNKQKTDLVQTILAKENRSNSGNDKMAIKR